MIHLYCYLHPAKDIGSSIERIYEGESNKTHSVQERSDASKLQSLLNGLSNKITDPSVKSILDGVQHQLEVLQKITQLRHEEPENESHPSRNIEDSSPVSEGFQLTMHEYQSGPCLFSQYRDTNSKTLSSSPEEDRTMKYEDLERSTADSGAQSDLSKDYTPTHASEPTQYQEDPSQRIATRIEDSKRDDPLKNITFERGGQSPQRWSQLKTPTSDKHSISEKSSHKKDSGNLSGQHELSSVFSGDFDEIFTGYPRERLNATIGSSEINDSSIEGNSKAAEPIAASTPKRMGKFTAYHQIDHCSHHVKI